LISMLTEDATWSMPPAPTWFQGVCSIRDWLVRDPLPLRWKHRPAWSNGPLAGGCHVFHPATGGYVPGGGGGRTPGGGKSSAVTAFQTADVAGLPQGEGRVTGPQFFARFGLPAELT